MYGVIDIGSNTIRLSCYHVTEGSLKYVFHKKRMAGLAGYVEEDGSLSERGIARLLEILHDMKEITESLVLEGLFVFATASLRNIVNTDEVLLRAKEATGFDIQVITGEEEARLDFLGVMGQQAATTGMLADIGGGSTELVVFEDRQICRAVSIPVGSLNLYTRHVKGILPGKEEMHQMKKAVKKELEKLELPEPAGVPEKCPEERKHLLVGVGGTCRALCKLYNEQYGEPAGNQWMDANRVLELMKRFRQHPEKEAGSILRIVPDRVHTILPGLTVLHAIIRHYGIEEIRISNWGVREGYLLDRLNLILLSDCPSLTVD